MPTWKTAEFFAGSGLVTEALKGFSEIVWANDVSPAKAAIYRGNHGSDSILLDDIRNVSGADLPSHDLSWASFPCQDLSLAGRLGGIEASRSGMFWEWLRLIDEAKVAPKVVSLENVAGLVSTGGGEHYRCLHRALTERGYRVGAMMLDAQSWLPQSRRRVFVVGIRSGFDTSSLESDHPDWHHAKAIQKAAVGLDDFVWWRLPDPALRGVDLQSIIEWDAPVFEKEKAETIFNLIPARHRAVMEAGARQRSKAVFPGYRRTRHGKQVLELRFDEISGCLRTAEGGSSRQLMVLWQNGDWSIRLLTPREAARLMGAPETYVLSENYNESYSAMGDAVAVPVVRFLAEHLLSPLVRASEASHVARRKSSDLCLYP